MGLVRRVRADDRDVVLAKERQAVRTPARLLAVPLGALVEPGSAVAGPEEQRITGPGADAGGREDSLDFDAVDDLTALEEWQPAMAGLEASGDFVGVACHGVSVSHVDALCHIFVDGRMYNGFDAGHVKSIGALRNSIMAARDGVVSRGVLLDIPRLRGVRWLEPGDCIAPDELTSAEHAQGVEVSEGDVLLVSTGRDARRARHGAWDYTQSLAGLHPTCVPWLHARRVAVLGCDGISDPLPPNAAPGWPVPIHQCCLVAMGVHLIDNLDLRALAGACAERGRWEFLLVVQPLRIARGTGSPVNPTAVF